MLYVAYGFLILVLLLDLIFYVKIKLHVLYLKGAIYIYVFSLPLLVISKNKTINRLKNTVSIEKLKNSKKEDLKIIESISLKKFYINFKQDYGNIKTSYLYPFIYIINSLGFNIENSDIKASSDENIKYKTYIQIQLQILNVIKEMLIIKGLKNERTSNK